MQIILKDYKIKNKNYKANKKQTKALSGSKIQLIGENGIGKTSLLKNIKKKGNKKIFINDNKKFTYISQSRFLIMDVSIKENIELLSKNEKYCIDIIKELFPKFNMNQKIKNLSGGQQQIIHVIIALSYNTDIIIADEPFNHVSQKNRVKLISLIKATKREIIIIDHQNIHDWCDTLIEIKGDRIEKI